MQRHDTDPISLLFGLLFLGVVAMLGVLATDASRSAVHLGFAIVLLGAGAAGLAASLHRGRERSPHL
jgi:uncharacterized membrane-anchored protein